MKAAYVETLGPIENLVVGDLPMPIVGDADVLVRVAAAGLNPVDLSMRSGAIAMGQPLPFVVGADFAGTVAAVGSGVSTFRVGDRVWGSNQQFFGRQGVAAEYASVHSDWVYPTPPSLSDLDAAALALTGITAHLGLFEFGELKAGQVVYVPGGAGGVGSMVVQMAKAAGASVATSAGRDESIRIAESLGADLVLNYRTSNVAESLRRAYPDGVDLWYETQREPDLEAAIPLLKPRGRVILMAGRQAKATLPVGLFYPKNGTIRGFAMFNSSAAEQRACAEDINKWSSTGRLKPVIGRVFPLSEAAMAHRFLEENTMGKAGTLAGKVLVSVIA